MVFRYQLIQRYQLNLCLFIICSILCEHCNIYPSYDKLIISYYRLYALKFQCFTTFFLIEKARHLISKVGLLSTV